MWLEFVWKETEEVLETNDNKELSEFSNFILFFIDIPLPLSEFNSHYSNKSLFACQVWK